MIKEENLGRYFNNLRNILRYKLETLDYFEQVSRMQELEKKAFWRLFYEKPGFCFIRTILFLPTYIWKFLDRSYDKLDSGSPELVIVKMSVSDSFASKL